MRSCLYSNPLSNPLLMRFLLLPLGGLLLGTTLPARAQTTPGTPAAPRFFVGLGAYSSYYQQLGGYTPYSSGGFRVPVQLTAGYQLSPRVAVQVGVAYSGSTAHTFDVGLVYNPASSRGTYFHYAASSTRRSASVSALARYTLTRNSAHRLQFDALGGITLEHGDDFERGTRADSVGAALVVSPFGYHAAQNTLLLTAGLGTRYRLGSRFELTYDFILNKALSGPAPHPAPIGLTGSQMLGLRYRFGR